MTENKKRFRIEFTVDAEGWSDKFIKDSAIQELTCMVPYPEDITFSEANPWHTGVPTEEGWYLFTYKHLDSFRYATDYYFVDRGWTFSVDKTKMLAWMPIEPYKEKQDGRTD